jgi:hypothetical protein
MGLVSMVFGILGFLCFFGSFVMVVFSPVYVMVASGLAFVYFLTALILGVIGRQRNKNSGMATAGFIMCIIGLGLTIISFLFLVMTSALFMNVQNNSKLQVLQFLG